MNENKHVPPAPPETNGELSHKEKLVARYPYDDMVKLLPFYRLLIGPLEERLGLRPLIRAFLAHPVPGHLTWKNGFGTIAFILFLIQVGTGYLLAMYYQPTPDHAHESIVMITTTVPFGWLVRSLHVWAANFMVVFVILHMVRVFWHGAYKYPREFNWMVGVLLLGLTVTFGFTGYLLPWNQISYWATVVGTETAAAAPFVGEYLLKLMRGGEQISAVTLTRFYAIHVFVLPLTLVLLLGAHFGMMRLQGFANPYKKAPDKPKHYHPFWPHHVLQEFGVAMFVFAALLALATFAPGEIGEKADPYSTPEHIKPEWYFLASYQFLKFAENFAFLGAWAPKAIGVFGQGVAFGALLLLPFWDRSPEQDPRRRRLALSIAGAVFVLWVFFTVWGHYS
jgi:ubiquinol-cytochrome c reductase cytochrome b subunit